MKKKLIFSTVLFGLCSTITLFSCKTISEPEVIQIDVKLRSQRLAFSNWNLASSTGALYKLNISGDIKRGDHVTIGISKQFDERGYEGQYIKLSDDSLAFELDDSSTDLTLRVLPFAPESKDIFKIDFTLEFQIMRSSRVIYKTQMNNLFFVNGTVTPKSIFETIEQDDDLEVVSFKDDPITLQQLTLCNIFMLPVGTTKVADHAFSLEKIPIPATIKRVYLDYSVLDLTATGWLKSIGAFAFEKNTFNNRIVVPTSTLEIGEKAFYQCSGVSEIVLDHDFVIHNYAFSELPGQTILDLTSFDDPNNLPQNWEHHMFDKIEDQTMVCYYNPNVTETTWRQFLSEHNVVDLSNWEFIPKTPNK